MIRTTATGPLFVWVVTAPIPAAALGPDQLAVIVNTAEEISRRDFEAGKAQLDERVPPTVQALARSIMALAVLPTITLMQALGGRSALPPRRLGL